jgi:CxxC motif-containing protein (DUF1111 family)
VKSAFLIILSLNLACGADEVDEFRRPLPTMSATQLSEFFQGKRFFNESWTADGGVGTLRGLGPLYSESSCSACHTNNARSQPPNSGEAAFGVVFKIHNKKTPSSGDPLYGLQIDYNATAGQLPEAVPLVKWKEEKSINLGSQTVRLRIPIISLEKLTKGPLASDSQVFMRIAPSIAGIGLLEAAGNGSEYRLGWKMDVSNINSFVKTALLIDSGVTSDNGTHLSIECQAGEVEASGFVVDRLTAYIRHLAPPNRARMIDESIASRGRQLFSSIGCMNCHESDLHFQTDLPLVFNQARIDAYTDMRVHDLGPDLADAFSQTWRTAPLWGLAHIKIASGGVAFLHDGRARTIEEAILWHGGEADSSREAYIKISEDDRYSINYFLMTL